MADETTELPTEESDKDLSGELVRKLVALPEAQMRHAVLKEYLAQLEDEDVLIVIRDILERSTQKIPRYMMALKTMTDVPGISQALGSARMSIIYSKAREEGIDHVTDFLTEIPAMRHAAESDEEIFRDHRLRDVSLGMKRSMGRRTDPLLIDRLLHEQHPMVIQNVLDNPSITEDQIIKIAAKRPTSAEILKLVARHPKWISRYRVKRALIFNPYTPTEVALRLVGFLMGQDLKEVVETLTLHPTIRENARSLLRKFQD